LTTRLPNNPEGTTRPENRQNKWKESLGCSFYT
jgi:hypothetical protein